MTKSPQDKIEFRGFKAIQIADLLWRFSVLLYFCVNIVVNSASCLAQEQTGSGGAAEAAQLLEALPAIYRTGLIELRSDGNVPDPKSIIANLSTIFAEDIKTQNLQRYPQTQGALIVGLATQEAVDRYISTKMGGRAVGARGFVAHLEGFLGSNSSVNWYVAAHEFEHVLMARLKATAPNLPVYLVEGIAVCVGTHTVRSCGLGTDTIRQQAKKLATISSTDVEDVFQNFITAADVAKFRSAGKLYSAELIGGLFVEFMASRKSQSEAQFFSDWADFAQDVGKGTSFESSFDNHFGYSLKAVQKDFLRYIDDTQENSSRRFLHTVYE